jgi:hypothetical protein
MDGSNQGIVPSLAKGKWGRVDPDFSSGSRRFSLHHRGNIKVEEIPQLWVKLMRETLPGQGGTIFKTLASGYLKVKGSLRRESYRRLFPFQPLDFIL